MRSHAALLGGSLYFSIVFAAGFVLGVPRTAVIVPAVGDVVAVLLEVPMMLAIAWVAVVGRSTASTCRGSSGSGF